MYKVIMLNNLEEQFEIRYAKLNTQQKTVVDKIEGPVLVIAGPGSGKTEVLAMRIANILKKTDTDPRNILCLTFTESGVTAMRKRLFKIIGQAAYYVNIYTFHSFCNDIIKEFPEKFMDFREMISLSDVERYKILQKALDELKLLHLKPFNRPYHFMYEIQSNISVLKRENVNLEQFRLLLTNKKEALNSMPNKINSKTGKETIFYKEAIKQFEVLSDLLQLYDYYQNALKENGRYDFEDMILFVLNKFKTDEELLLICQENYQYILVDEFQDTNSSQNGIVQMLSSYFENPNIFVVGDDDQSIYRFQGANLENILQFKTSYPSSEIVVLKENYRSTQFILNTAMSVVENNEGRLTKLLPNISKELHANNINNENKPVVYEFTNGDTENYFILTKIQELIDSGVKPSEIAVLYRHNKDCTDILNILNRNNVPCEIEGGIDILKDINLKNLLKLFYLISDIEDNFAFFHVLNTNFLDFNIGDVFKIGAVAKEKKGENIFDYLLKKSQFEKLELKEPTQMIQFVNNLLKWQKDDYNLTFITFFEHVINESGYLKYILNSEDSVEHLNRLNTLFNMVKGLNRSNHDLKLSTFLEEIEFMMEYNIKLPEEILNMSEGGVKLMTAHKSKGLEFDYVFIVKAIDGKFGNNKMSKSIKLPDEIFTSNVDNSVETELEDDRRLFYTAMTRARNGLFITYATSYTYEGKVRDTFESIFITELQGVDLVKNLELEPLNILKSKFIDQKGLSLVDNRTLDQFTGELDIDLTRCSTYFNQLISNFTLSATGLNTYIDCHRKFLYRNLLRIPGAKNKAMSFGSAVHKALEIFYKKYKIESIIESSDFLYEQFKKAIQKETLTKEELESSLLKGRKILNNYYENYKSTMIKPLFIEYFFGGIKKVYLGDIPLNGKLDKIELLDGNRVKVIDYKTGKPKSRNYIEGNTQDSEGELKRQLMFYKLLTDSDKSFNYCVAEGEFDFIEPMQSGNYKRESFNLEDAQVLDEFKEVVKETMHDIRSQKFEKTTTLKHCNYCEFRDICKR